MNAGSGRDLTAASVLSRAADPPYPLPDATNAAHFAVVVGINRYPGFTDLDGPMDDAADFVDWLVSPSGGALPKENVFEVPAPRERNASLPVHFARPNVPDVVEAVRSANLAVAALTRADPGAWSRSRLYFFVAGHGMMPEHCDSVALFTADASRDELGHNINLREYKLWYEHCGRFRDLIVFADCCRSLMLDAPSYGPPFTWCRDGRGGVRTVMGYGTQFAAQAFEGPCADGTRGYFTAALLSGLRRAGSSTYPRLLWGDLRGMISIGLRGQQAEFVGDDDVEFGPPVSAGHRIDPTPVTIHFPEQTDERVDLLDGRLRLVGHWSPSNGEWRLILPDGLYQLVRHGTREELRGFTVMGVDVNVRL